MFLLAAVQKSVILVGSFSAIAGGIYVVDRMSWVEEHLGHVIQVKKMSGTSWTQLYEYDLDRRLLVYKYCDSQCRNHTIRYDPDTGHQRDHTVD